MKKLIIVTGLFLTFIVAGLVFATEGVPLQNGTFDEGLEQWTLSPEQEETGVVWDLQIQAAILMPYSDTEEELPVDTNSILLQVFFMPENADKLSFDITMEIECEGPQPETDVLTVTIDGSSIYQLTSSNIFQAALNNDPNVSESSIGDGYVYYALFSDNIVNDVSDLSENNVELKFKLHNENNDGCVSSVWIDNVEVTEFDLTPPTVEIGGMTELWPPNHKYHTFSLSDCVSVMDNVDGQMDVDESGRIISIYSDEPEEVYGNGDGKTYDDIVILSNNTFKVRAERQGASNGRVYGITFEIEDESGNSTEATFYLGVPHDQSGDPPVDDGAGAGYTVNN